VSQPLVRLWLLATLIACGAAQAREPDLVLHVDLDPSSRALSAVAELAKPAGERFGLHESLHVRRVAETGGGKVRIEYAGTLPPLDASLDHRGVLRALPPMASMEGSFLPAGSGWYPAPEGPFTYRVTLTLRSGHKALVAGRLLSEEEQAATSTYKATFEHAVPAEGIDLMAGPYEVRERMAGMPGGAQVRLRTYFFKELSALSEAYLQDSAGYLERFSRAIGPYPFSEFSVVASPLPTGFGMPTLTYLGASVLNLPFIRATSLGHEVLHNWWGNGVRVDYERGNWAEGLTTFMADYAFRVERSAASARDMRLGWLRDLAAAPAQEPLAAFRARTHGTAAVTGYAKAAMVFLMLRDMIGEAAFDQGVRRFWEQQRFRTAAWQDLRRAFEEASGLPLGPFFEQWLTRGDAPSIAIAGARYADGKVALDLRQEAGGPGGPYVLRVPIELESHGRREIRVIELRKGREVASIEVASKPDAVRLDPELRLWRRLREDELPPILRQWILAPSPVMAVAGSSGEMRQGAEALASRVFESRWKTVRPEERPRSAPLLLVGLHADIDAALKRLKLPPRPALLADQGTAQVWTIPGTAVAVVSARDAASIEALQRALPHYGAQSWLVFEGARVTERGAWPPAVRSVPVK
jgi:aminopeptidase N